MFFLVIVLFLSFITAVSFVLSSSFSLMSIIYGILIFLGTVLSLTLLLILILAILILCQSKNAKVEGDKPFFRWYLYHVVNYAFVFLRVKYKAVGLDKLPPENQRFLLVSNHINESDPLFLLLALTEKYPMGVIAKKDIWNWFFVPNAITALGCIPIDRENDREAAKTIINASKILKEDKLSMAVFPEGYTEKGRGLLPFRDGVFKIAQRAQVPIVVATLRGSDKFFKNLFFKKNYIEIKILDCISFEDIESLKTHEIGAVIHEKMEKDLNC